MMRIMSKKLEHQITILNTNNLHVVLWIQIFLSKVNNNFQTDLFDR